MIEYLSRARTGAIGAPPRSTAAPEEALDPAFRDTVKGVMRSTFLREYAQIRALGKLSGFEMLILLQPEVELEASELLGAQDRALRRSGGEEHAGQHRGRDAYDPGDLAGRVSLHRRALRRRGADREQHDVRAGSSTSIIATSRPTAAAPSPNA